jgi:DnaJ-class molecular chaperone
MPKNYYVILGLNRTASPRQIKDAYRRLAKELHPDRSGNESAPFRELHEAYGVLSDPVQRQHYDRSVSGQRSHPRAESLRQTGFFSQGGIEPLIPKASSRDDVGEFQPSFEELLSHWWGNFDHSIRRRSDEPERLTVEVWLSPEEAQRGGFLSLGIPVRTFCPSCHGQGSLGEFRCQPCAGSGIREVEYPIQLTYLPSASDSIQQIDLRPLGVFSFILAIHFRIG